jgi:hypothetical protein
MMAFGREDVAALLSPRDPDLLSRYEPRRRPAWRALPYALLHRYLLEEVIQRRFSAARAPVVHYHKSLREALAEARESSALAALMPACSMTRLREVCTAGELMPQKSTYFFPKLATGLVIHPLY